MKPVRLTRHAQEQCIERGASQAEVVAAAREGTRETAKSGRELCRYNLPYDDCWQGRRYAVKQVAPVVKEEPDETVVITVYVFYF